MKTGGCKREPIGSLEVFIKSSIDIQYFITKLDDRNRVPAPLTSPKACRRTCMTEALGEALATRGLRRVGNLL